jgi:hypothetical protein
VSANKPANDALPLSLDLPTLPPTADLTASAKSGRGMSALLVAAIVCVVVAGGVIYTLRSRVAPRTAPPPVPVTVAQPSPPPSAATPTPAAAPGKPAEPAPAVPVADVTFEVNSEPRGAEVTVDGKAVGSTPVSLTLPAQAAVELRVHSAGFAAKTERVTPATGMAPLQIALTPLPYLLTITTEPSGATVRVGENKVIAPAPLELGHIDAPVSASIEKDGYQRMSRSVRLDEFHEQDGSLRAELSVSLSALPGARRRAAAAAPSRASAAPEAPPEPGAPEPPEAPPVMQVKPAASDEAPPAAKEIKEAAPPSAAPAEPAAPPKPAPSEPAAAPAPATP